MTEGKPGIMLYYRTTGAMEDLDDGQFGRLVRAMLDYGRSGKEPKLEGTLAAVWPFLKDKIDDDDARYAKMRRQRQQAINKRWDKVRAEKAEKAEKGENWMAAYIQPN